MQSVLGLLALVALCQGIPTNLIHGGRIVNGDDAKIGEFPYQVSLQTLDGFHFCGASLLSEYYVITAAHCVVDENASNLQVVAGSLLLSEPQTIKRVVKITVHEDYNPNHSWSNDIALVKVSSPFEVSNTLNFVSLPVKHGIIKEKSPAVISGWGSIQIGGPSPDHLQRTDVLITSLDYCNLTNSIVGLPVYDGHLCALNPNYETGPCHGDSGGPLTAGGKLIGIASWVISCASSVFPTVYTRVPEYIDWIHAHAV